MAMFIDPPEGWRYGFPKEAPSNIREMRTRELSAWLVANGYPQDEVDWWEGEVPVRFFQHERDKLDDTTP